MCPQLSSCRLRCIESLINEYFIDWNIYFKECNKCLIKEIWEYIGKEKILEKYQFAMVLKQKQKMSKSCSEYQDVDTLIKMRNATCAFQA